MTEIEIIPCGDQVPYHEVTYLFTYTGELWHKLLHDKDYAFNLMRGSASRVDRNTMVQPVQLKELKYESLIPAVDVHKWWKDAIDQNLRVFQETFYPKDLPRK